MDVVYAERGNRKLKLDIHYPSSPAPAKGYPLIISFHGGGWIIGHRRHDLFMKPLIEDGYALASVEYRLSGEAKYPAQIEDAREAASWLIEHAKDLGLDPSRFGVTGMSAGGHIALLLAYTQALQLVPGGSKPLPPHAIKAACVFYAPTDLAEIIPAEARDKPRNLVAALLGAPVSERLALAKHGSPINYVTGDTPPTFLIHGTIDKVVPISQSKLLYADLQAKRVPSSLRMFDAKPHGFRPDAVTLDRIYQFWKRHLSP